MLRAAVRVRSLVTASSPLLAALVACNALFGIESAGFEPPPATTSAPDGAAPRDGAAPEGAAPEEEEDAGPCVDLDRNPRHCGACSHTCFGGACTGGECQPYVLARQPDADIYGLAISRDSAFYNDVKSGSIRRAPLAGGPSTPFHASTTLAGAGTRLAVHGDALYFVDANVVMRCPLAGCASGAEVAVKTTAPISAFSIDTDGSIAVANAGAAGGIARCSSPPCLPGSPKLRVVAIDEQGPANIAVAGQWVAWTTFGPLGGSQSLRLGAVGVEPRTIVTGSYILNVAMTKDLIVYGNPNEALLAISFDGAAGRTLATTKRSTDFLVIDGEALVYADARESAVMRVPLDAKTPPAPLAREQADPLAIAADATSYYWANTGDGTVMRLAR